MLIKYWYHILIKKDIHQATNKLINSLCKYVSYDYETLKNLEVINYESYLGYLIRKPNQGRTFLIDIKDKNFDGKIYILEYFLHKVKQRVLGISIIRLALTTSAFLLLLINPLLGLVTLTLSNICGKILVKDLFFSDVSAGKRSQLLNRLISETKIEHAEVLRCSTLAENEWERFLKRLPIEVRRTADILWRDGSYKNISDLLEIAKRL